MVLGWGVAPSEFWNMTMGEASLLYEGRRPSTQTDYAGRLTKGDVEELAEWIRSAKTDGPSPA